MCKCKQCFQCKDIFEVEYVSYHQIATILGFHLRTSFGGTLEGCRVILVDDHRPGGVDDVEDGGDESDDDGNGES